MLEGAPITKDSLSKLPSNQGKTITDVMCAQAAADQKGTNQPAIQQRLDVLKDKYGNGVSTLIRIYNATGVPLRRKYSPDWSGHVGDEPIESVVANGQWTGFLHVHTAGSARGSWGAIVYETFNTGSETQASEFFIGWCNPYTGNNGVYVEVREPGHWWKVGSESFMQDKTDNGPKDDSSVQRGLKVMFSQFIATSTNYNLATGKRFHREHFLP
ncbi:hypothetical protein C8J56DRAFT_1084607 [Mycena floridula]|nr:hypothetical protein C8J56DRAFT_1084607 [Mycena floridula]